MPKRFWDKNQDGTVNKGLPLRPFQRRRHLGPKIHMEQLAGAGRQRPYKCRRHLGVKVHVETISD